MKKSNLQSKKAVQKAKEPVRIRFKPLANGNQSIYLDCYRDGQRSYEFLKLYLVPESGHAAKEANAQTLALANAVKAQRVVELQNSAHGFTSSGTRSKAKLVDYILAMAEQKRTNAGGGKRTIAGGYRALAKHVEAYSGTKTTFRQVNKAYCVGFIDHLKAVPNQTTGLLLGTNTQAGYMRMLSTVISAAVADEILDGNPFHQVKPENKPKKHKSEIVYLTAGELQQMESTDYQHASTKHAFLFSCYTGLRWSDVEGLTWGMLQKDNKGGTVISHVQRKTKKQEYLPIPQKAVKLLPDRASAKDTDKVFDLFTSTYVNMQLRVWAALAGVHKHLTFHVARHTYATLLLSLGARIEVISENLGHSEIRTTQAHYAAVENKLQREAVNLLDRLNGLTQ